MLESQPVARLSKIFTNVLIWCVWCIDLFICFGACAMFLIKGCASSSHAHDILWTSTSSVATWNIGRQVHNKFPVICLQFKSTWLLKSLASPEKSPAAESIAMIHTTKQTIALELVECVIKDKTPLIMGFSLKALIISSPKFVNLLSRCWLTRIAVRRFSRNCLSTLITNR